MILLSGATGNVGSATAKILNRENVPFRVLVRNPEKFAIVGPNVDVVKGDLKNENDVKKALSGVTKALLVMGNNPSQLLIEKQFASLAADAGVEHLIKISSMEAAEDATAVLPKNHFASEQHIRSLDLNWTFLRPN